MNAIQVHLLLNHVPVIGALIAVLLLGYALLRRSSELVKASFGMIVLAALLSVVVFLTGEPAEEAIEQLSGIPTAVVERHEAAALTSLLLLGSAGILALAGLLVYRRRATGIPQAFAAVAFLVALVPTAAMGYTASLGGQIRHSEVRHDQPAGEAAAHQIGIPDAMRVEHAELQAALTEATRASGRVGEAARAVLRVLQPHFEREEQIALPPLGLLSALSQGAVTRGMTAVLPLTDSLTAELPHMLEEHVAIGAALKNLAEVARVEGAVEYAKLAERIMLHAQTEEQITYPAAIVVGAYVRTSAARLP